MTELKFVEIEPTPLDRFRPLIGERYAQAEQAAADARAAFGGRRIRDNYLAVDRLREYVALVGGLVA